MNMYQYIYLLVLTVVSGYFTFSLSKDFVSKLDTIEIPLVYVAKLLSAATIFAMASTFIVVEASIWIWNFLGSIN
jgi:hypothetical protein